MTRQGLRINQALGRASLVSAGLSALLLVGGSPGGAPCAYAGVGQIFTQVGESQFQVPNGIYGITVTLDAGSGGNGKQIGGAGAEVTAMVGVNPNSTVYVEVGGNGGNGNGVKAYNGGGAGSFGAGGGGGASDIRTCAAASCPLTGDVSTDPRLLVAGGGGEINTSNGGSGGNADYNSTNPPGNGGDGVTCQSQAGETASGPGGAGATGSAAGGNGSAGQGGYGYFSKNADMSVGAGAGGGGWFGGGGGSLNQTLQGPFCGGGGGSGSSYATSLAFNVGYGVNTSGSPSVTISYGTPAIVPYAHFNMHVMHGWTTLHWVSLVPVAGYNVYAGVTRLNTHLVVGHGHRYNFTIHRVIRDVHLMPVPLR